MDQCIKQEEPSPNNWVILSPERGAVECEWELPAFVCSINAQIEVEGQAQPDSA